jgi:hypothetical protein
MVWAYSSIAQPVPHGCDHKHHLVKPKPLTAIQKANMEASIARSDTFDIVHYNIYLDVVNASAASIKANTTVTYAPKLNDVGILNLDLRQLTVDSVKQDGQLLNFVHADHMLKIYLPAPTVSGDTTDLTVWYKGSPYKDPQWGGFYFAGTYIYNLGIGISTIPPNFGKVWYPCFDTFFERATYEYHILTGGGRTAYCQGILMGRDTLGTDSILSHYHFNYPITTHVSAFAANQYIALNSEHIGAYDTIPVQLVCRQTDAANMNQKFQNLGYAIDALEHWYGKHYYGRVGYVLTTDGALEIAENIAYPQFMVTQGQGNNDRLIAHELGHQWWGNVVAPALHNHMWLKEGPAEYSAHLMTEWKDGPEAFSTQVKNNLKYVLEVAHADDNGFWQLSPIPDPQIYGRHTYYKGALVMHNLRGYMGDELFRLGLQAVLEQKENSQMWPEEFRDILSEATGVNLDHYFDNWVFSPGYATFVIDSTVTAPSGNQFQTTVHLKQLLREAPELYTNVPLEISLYDSNWQRHVFETTASGATHSVTFSSDFHPVLTGVNVDHRLNLACLDLDRTYTTTTGLQLLPFVDFRVQVLAAPDSILLRVEHHYAGPDSDNRVPWIEKVSSTHFWTVDGVWPEGSSLLGRVNYSGAIWHQLDYDLISDTEEFITLAYRKDPSEPWAPYPYLTITAGNLFNGNGQIRMDSLLLGQYAFARLDPSVAVSESPESRFLIYPNPTSETIRINGSTAFYTRGEIMDMQGKLAKKITQGELKSGTVSVSALQPGLYHIRLFGPDGEEAEAEKLVIVN